MSSLIRIGVGTAAGLCLFGLFIYRQVKKRRRRRRSSGEQLCARREEVRAVRDAEAELQPQVAAAVMEGLCPQKQLEVLEQLEQVLSSVASLRAEVAELRCSLQNVAQQIIQDVKKEVEDSHRTRRRRCAVLRERTDSTSSSSIYFSASQGVASTYDGETSEGGYSTAYAESDYTDRDEVEHESDEDASCVTVLTLRQDDSPEEEEGQRIQFVDEVAGGKLVLPLAQ
ncbi:regulator of microtubule dynamics protein 3-like [Thalassophryne amazonica]|uniref:regulator of microtubule dynamics protein 3-like n=1 Tax=Thalassophryne amazonica TaxID=390379 RepID=UPI00147243FC|nr:regulator of microtubule dynamics protein 3-like [Thalassophryne amazonica]